jgi:simple sugar transport system permease protein
MSERMRRSLFTVVGSLFAILIALVLCGILLRSTGRNPIEIYRQMVIAAWKPKARLNILQRSTPLIISGVAVAIGFKMNLFNIGVEGQYRLATLFAAVVGATVNLPAIAHVSFCIAIAMLTGAIWAGIAAALKVGRGVNEVISTIMLNSIAIGLAGWLFDSYFRSTEGGDLNVKSKELPTTAWMPNLVSGKDGTLNSFFLVALLVAFVYWVVVWATPFGFRLRATGAGAEATRVAGVNPSRMIVKTMLLSGAVAGLVGMSGVLGETPHAYSQGLAKDLGFTGIAVALLGRNHPVGIVFSAVLFAFLDRSAQALQLNGVPKEIVIIIQGITVLSVVIVNEALSRLYQRLTQAETAKKESIGAPPLDDPGDEGAAAALAGAS